MSGSTKARTSKNTRKRKAPEQGQVSALKTFGIAVLLGGLSAIGLWRCLAVDENDFAEPDAGAHPAKAVIDAADTSLDNEEALLEQMRHSKVRASKKAQTKAEPELPAVQPEAPKVEPKTETKPSEKADEKPVKPAESKAAQTKPAEPEKPAPVKATPPPPPDKFPLFAVAYQFHTQIRSEPSAAGKVLGYTRRGATFKVSERLSRKGCEKGWHEIAPGGVYACAGEGIIVAKEPVSFNPSPVQPRVDAPLPYSFAFVAKDGVPQYWRLPTKEETEQVASLLSRTGAKGALPGGANEAELDKAALARVLAKAAAIAEEADGGVGSETEAEAAPVAPPPAAAAEPVPAFLHMRMNKGFYVSTDGRVDAPSGKYLRTVRGRFLPEGSLIPAKPSDFHGTPLGGKVTLPLVYVVASGAKTVVEKKDGVLAPGQSLERLTRLSYVGEKVFKGRKYVQIGGREFVAEGAVTVVREATPPSDIGADERWINVDLSAQTLVSYEGKTPVFATLISSGRAGHETPRGSFRIYSKHVTITMDDLAAGDEAYSIEDVPWTQYFEDGFALHTAFWHNSFGRQKSHGCVNLAPADARRLFFWTGPHLPGGLHGIMATRDNPGTRVVVHE